jgi:hypothetical protein
MTLSTRNIIFKLGISLALLCLVGLVVSAFIIVPVYPEVAAAAVRRSSGIVQALVARFLPSAPYVPFATPLLAVVYALIAIILIYYFFEKTPSPEILFFALFVLSFVLEGSRIMAPLRQVYDLPSLFLVISSRVLLFSRYFGLFSLFAASVYAAGLGEQKQGNIIFIIALAALVISLGVPVDGLSWDSSLAMISGYASMFKLVESGIVIITMISFFIAAYGRGTREYIFIGTGALLVCWGRNLLFNSDTWVTPLPAMGLLVAGTWLICVQLHRVYLWL